MNKERLKRESEKEKGEYSESKDQIARKRTARTPLGRRVQKMNAPLIDGFYLRWINDNGNRLMRAEQAGYEFVKKNGENTFVKVDSENSSKKAYLMKLPMVYRKEDLLKKRQEVEATLGKIKDLKNKVEKGYIPNEEGKVVLSEAEIEELVQRKIEEIMSKKGQ